jgi:hypothetical protein
MDGVQHKRGKGLDNFLGLFLAALGYGVQQRDNSSGVRLFEFGHSASLMDRVDCLMLYASFAGTTFSGVAL